MSANLFQTVVNRETVASFGIDMSLWTEGYQAELNEGMILALKENPEWTEDQARDACRSQVKAILFRWFKKNMRYAVEDADWSLEKSFENFFSMPLVKFLELLAEDREYTAFCEEFYGTLRERYNICSAGMWDEYQRMKKNDWSFSDYRKDLKKRK
jgi:hypothetical protein